MIYIDKFLNISLLAKYRTQLMGIAMVWVILYHFGIGEINLPIINFIGKSGYGGVDLFLFLSGIGIYYSISKDSNSKKFYFKRLIRIFPYYIPIVLIMMIIKNQPVGQMLLNITTLSFWLHSLFVFDWYIPALVFFYVLTPVHYRFFNKKPLLTTIIAIVIALVISVLFVQYKLLTTRIPVYFIGFYVGYLINHKLPLKKYQNVIILLLGVMGVIWLYYNIFYLEYNYKWETGLWWYPFILITFPLLSLFSSLLNLFSKYNFPVLTFMGKYSLVLYLLHWNILPLLNKIIFFENNKILARLVALILTIVLGYLYQNIIERIINKTFYKAK